LRFQRPITVYCSATDNAKSGGGAEEATAERGRGEAEGGGVSCSKTSNRWS